MDFVSVNDARWYTRITVFFKKYSNLIQICQYGFCFRKWRWVTYPNGPGFCFRKWRWVTFPDFWLYLTFIVNIFLWWRHTRDLMSCTYTLTGTLSDTYDVLGTYPFVTSLVTKNFFLDFVSVNDAGWYTQNVVNMGEFQILNSIDFIKPFYYFLGDDVCMISCLFNVTSAEDKILFALSYHFQSNRKLSNVTKVTRLSNVTKMFQ